MSRRIFGTLYLKFQVCALTGGGYHHSKFSLCLTKQNGEAQKEGSQEEAIKMDQARYENVPCEQKGRIQGSNASS
jgi:hypothetical protein